MFGWRRGASTKSTKSTKKKRRLNISSIEQKSKVTTNFDYNRYSYIMSCCCCCCWYFPFWRWYYVEFETMQHMNFVPFRRYWIAPTPAPKMNIILFVSYGKKSQRIWNYTISICLNIITTKDISIFLIYSYLSLYMHILYDSHTENLNERCSVQVSISININWMKERHYWNVSPIYRIDLKNPTENDWKSLKEHTEIQKESSKWKLNWTERGEETMVRLSALTKF